MALPISPDDPIVVVVEEDRWDAYSMHETPTDRDEELLALIHKMGGINEKVEPGRYHFNAAPLDETHMVVSLELIRG